MDLDPPQVAAEHGHAVRRRARVPRWLGGTLFALAVLAILSVALDLGTASPRLCSSCHEMSAHAESWEQSAHGVVSCVACHQEPTEWYELPSRLSSRVALLTRDLTAHWALGSEALAAEGMPSLSPDMPDEVCLQCHDPNRKATSGYRILIDHPEHAKRNKSCVSCHIRTAHPEPTRGGPLSLMGQCYTCHGTAEYPEASVECATCHPSDYDPVPAAHKEPEWLDSHGQTSLIDGTLCLMCHERSFCSDCHGVEMPHPEGWTSGTAGHTGLATSDAATCARCHGGGEQTCTACHHTTYEPARGPWVGQHMAEARQTGAASCMQCHEPTSCSFCHTRLVEGDGVI